MDAGIPFIKNVYFKEKGSHAPNLSYLENTMDTEQTASDQDPLCFAGPDKTLRFYITFFMHKPAEHEICPPHKC